MWTHWHVLSKCKLSNSHTNLTTLFSRFLLFKIISPLPNMSAGGHMICMGDLGEFFLVKILQKAPQRPTKVNFPFKEISGRNGDHE